MEGFDVEVDICFNSNIPFDKIFKYDKVVLSPGPGLPGEAGDLMKFIEKFHDKIPILGICLGFQALAEFYGGQLVNQAVVKHGIKEKCFFDTTSLLFLNTPTHFKIGLYHSWAVSEIDFPKVLTVTAKSENDIIMAFEHKNKLIFGVQFHPESIMTEYGHDVLHNFLIT